MNRDLLEDHGAQHGDKRNGECRNEEFVPPALRTGFTFLARYAVLLALAQTADARDENHHDDEKSIREIRQMRARKKGDRVDRPEGCVVEASRVAPIAPVDDSDARHHETTEPVDVLESDHACSDFRPSSTRSRRSSSRSRVQWITNAQIAVGIAQIASCVGSTWIPF